MNLKPNLCPVETKFEHLVHGVNLEPVYIYKPWNTFGTKSVSTE
jgi:hypothetical protein